MKVANLSGAALDWAVAKCEGIAYHLPDLLLKFEPSKFWAQGGPIIEREKIVIEPFKGGNKWSSFMFNTGDCEIAADTPLIAAMRCYVASKLGEDIDIPNELL